jgi:hypothetical protein
MKINGFPRRKGATAEAFHFDLWQPHLAAGIQIAEIHMSQFCQIEHVDSDSDIGTPCGNSAVAECADCAAAICSDYRTWCCGQSFCEQCGDYHATNSCVRKPVQNERYASPKVFGSWPDKAG